MTKIEKHKKLCDSLNEIYRQKNTAYGDSFGETFRKLGIISAVTRISDKYNRLTNLATHPDVDSGDESIKDTLLDMANYCIMTVIEIDEYRSQNAMASFREWADRYNAMRSVKERVDDATKGVQA